MRQRIHGDGHVRFVSLRLVASRGLAVCALVGCLLLCMLGASPMLPFTAPNAALGEAGTAGIQVLDCTPGTTGCSLLVIQGDPPYTLPQGRPSNFSGTADPSVRRDPLSHTLWLSYSWPHYEFLPDRIAAVEIHLAESPDGGATWNAVKTLWPTDVAVDPRNPSQKGVVNHEVSNLLPVEEGGGVSWYAARLSYFLPAGGHPVGESFRIHVMKASSPEELGTAADVSLGSASSDPAWPIDQNLSALSPDLADVALWNEPSLYYEDGTLYLILVSFHYARGVPALDRDKVHVFSTTPSGLPTTWIWTYRGVLAGSAEAAELGGQRLTQVDVALGLDGKLLMLATPDDWNPAYADYNHKGCVVVEIASLAAPALARGADGKLKLRARVTASDANSLGSAASAYDPASLTGLPFTRRDKTPTEFHIEVWSTSLRF